VICEDDKVKSVFNEELTGGEEVESRDSLASLPTLIDLTYQHRSCRATRSIW